MSETIAAQSSDRLSQANGLMALHAALIAESVETSQIVGHVVPMEVPPAMAHPGILSHEHICLMATRRRKNNLQITAEPRADGMAYLLTGRS